MSYVYVIACNNDIIDMLALLYYVVCAMYFINNFMLIKYNILLACINIQ